MGSRTFGFATGGLIPQVVFAGFVGVVVGWGWSSAVDESKERMGSANVIGDIGGELESSCTGFVATWSSSSAFGEGSDSGSYNRTNINEHA